MTEEEPVTTQQILDWSRAILVAQTGMAENKKKRQELDEEYTTMRTASNDCAKKIKDALGNAPLIKIDGIVYAFDGNKQLSPAKVVE